jgi:glutamate/tyrosine decarboxylase-like PLP-dependent enzyme
MERPRPVADLDWSSDTAKELGARALDLWAEWLGKLRSLPVARAWKGRDLGKELGIAIPDGPRSIDDLASLLRALVFDTSMYPGHPGFMAYITGPGTVPGAIADLVAAAINQNVGGYRLSPAATEIELFLTRWFARDLFGLPGSAGGLFVSGGAMANFVALKAARDKTMSYEVRENGVGEPGTVAWYASAEAHGVIDRAADMLGLGSKVVRKIPVDAEYRMDLEELQKAVLQDLTDGFRPAVVVATAGTVATGAIDPLGPIADLCRMHGMWMHVDGAYGALAKLAPELAPLFAGIEHADSIAFDPHKWLYTPHSGGCVVVRDLQRLADSFAIHATYVHEDKARTGHGTDLAMLGPQFSRGFSALKVYLSLVAHGRAAYARRIAHDVELARWLAAKVDEQPELERFGEPSLSICCFRYAPKDTGAGTNREGYLDKLNERLMTELQTAGRVYCSNAVLRGRFVLRACIVNYRTEADEIEALVDEVVKIGKRVDRELRIQ